MFLIRNYKKALFQWCEASTCDYHSDCDTPEKLLYGRSALGELFASDRSRKAHFRFVEPIFAIKKRHNLSSESLFYANKQRWQFIVWIAKMVAPVFLFRKASKTHKNQLYFLAKWAEIFGPKIFGHFWKEKIEFAALLNSSVSDNVFVTFFIARNTGCV